MKPQVEGSELSISREVIDDFFCCCCFLTSEVGRKLIKDKDSCSECYVARGLFGSALLNYRGAHLYRPPFWSTLY